MTEEFWADGATKNCVWLFQIKMNQHYGERDEFFEYWHTEAVFLTRKEANAHGVERPYVWGKKNEGWRIYGVQCFGIMAELLGKHSEEFEEEVEYITKKVTL